MRARDGLPPFRETALTGAIRRVIARASRDVFRVLHFSIQTNHVHLIVEAHDEAALARGMQRLAALAAKAVNGVLEIRGTVWGERYHARELVSPRSVRNALVYVLMNARKHGVVLLTGIDACSSAPWFDGFADYAPLHEGSPVRAPRTWLAGVGWRRRGLVRRDEHPRTHG
jgi:putative transposase